MLSLGAHAGLFRKEKSTGGVLKCVGSPNTGATCSLVTGLVHSSFGFACMVLNHCMYGTAHQEGKLLQLGFS